MTQRNLFQTTMCFALVLLLFGCSTKRLEPESKFQVASVGLNAGAFSDDGQYAIVGSVHHGISLWRTKDMERLFDWNHKKNELTTLVAADFSPDGKWALTADVHTLVLWNVDTGEAPRFWRAPGAILSVQLSNDGDTALLGLSDHTAVLFDIKRGGVLRTLNHANRVRSVALSDNGKYAVTGSEDYRALYWDLENDTAVSKQLHEDDVQLVAISDDGATAFSMSKYDKALLWTTKDGQVVGELPLHAERLKRGLLFVSARFGSEGKYLLTGRPDQIVSLWDVKGLSLIWEWEIPKKNAWKPTSASVLDVAFVDEHTLLALASNGYIHTLRIPK